MFKIKHLIPFIFLCFFLGKNTLASTADCTRYKSTDHTATCLSSCNFNEGYTNTNILCDYEGSVPKICCVRVPTTDNTCLPAGGECHTTSPTPVANYTVLENKTCPNSGEHCYLWIYQQIADPCPFPCETSCGDRGTRAGGCDTPGHMCCASAKPETVFKDAFYNGPVITDIMNVIKPVAKILYYGGLFIGICFIVYAGYVLMVSEGNPQTVQEGKEMLTAAILGILFILLSSAILRVIINSIIGGSINV
jgi:hypothetical protein